MTSSLSPETTSRRFKMQPRNSRQAATLPQAREPGLRICVLAACPFPANHGTPGSIRELAEATASRGHAVHLVTYHFGEQIPVQGVNLHRIKARTSETAIKVGPTRYKPLYDLQMVFKAIGVIRRHKIDVIHAHGYEAALVAWLVRMVTRRPVIYSAHNSMGDELASYNFFRFRWFANSLAWVLDRSVPRIGNRCIPHSKNLEKFLHDRGLAKRTEPVLNFGIDVDSIPNGDRQALRKQYRLGEEPVVIYSGVMDRFQRLDLLLEAMQKVLVTYPDAKLVMVVTVPEEEHQARLKAKISELGIGSQVIFTEPQDLEGACRHLGMADVAVVPRPAAPGFPIKLLNYMATSRACVLFASSASGIDHGQQAWLVNRDSSSALGDEICHVLADEKLRAELGRRAHQFVKTHHDRFAVAGKIIQVYQRVLKGSRRWSEVIQRPCVRNSATQASGSPVVTSTYRPTPVAAKL